MSHTKTNIFLFNPTCELALANGSPYFHPPALLRQFEQELAPIMQFFASKNDHVLVDHPVSTSFTERMQQFGLLKSKILAKPDSLEIIGYKQSNINLQPWGWSPAAINFFNEYKGWNDQKQLAQSFIDKKIAERKHAVQLVNQLVTENPRNYFPKPDQLPQLLYTLDEVEQYLLKHQQIVLKAPLSSSGRGLQVIRKSQLNTSNKQWIASNLSSQGYLVGEPLFDKKYDLSFQYEVHSNHQIEFKGVSFFKTNNNGQYLGHYLNEAPANLLRAFSLNFLNQLAALISGYLQKSIYAENYCGRLGVDVLIYEANGSLAIQPCLEINARYTMGSLSHSIEKRIHPDSKGTFNVYYNPKISFREFVRQESQSDPPEAQDGLMRRGFMPITDARVQSYFGAFIQLNDG